jgi:glycosyltransferase involved in cell wall biosynthesis
MGFDPGRSIDQQVPVRDAPKVSIGMPVYNGEQYLRRALDSLLAQTFSDFELIISDNASTDKTYEICKQYALTDSRIILFRQTENIGVHPNFRFVIERSQGEYFFWAPHDDWWDSNFIKSGVLALDKCKTAAGAFGIVYYLDKEGSKHPKGSEFLRDQPPYHLDYDSAYRRIKSYVTGNITDHLIYAFFRRNTFRDFVWENSIILEKKLIVHAIGKGEILDCYDMKYKNYYAPKTNDEFIDCFLGKLRDDYPIQIFKDILSEFLYFLNKSEMIKILPIFIIKGSWHKFFVKHFISKLNSLIINFCST